MFIYYTKQGFQSQMNLKRSFIMLIALLLTSQMSIGQSPGGVSAGLRTWYKAGDITGKSNGNDVDTWNDSYTADGAAQNAVQNGLHLAPTYFGNRQPQYRTAVARYNFNPYVDFTKTFSGLMALNAHSTRPDYSYNYNDGATLYQVGDLTNNQGWFLGTGLGANTGPYYSGKRVEYGLPWWGLNQNYYGQATGYYYATVDDYPWYTFPFPPYNYNYNRKERKTFNTIPYISSVSYDRYATYKTCCVVGTDANTAIQTRVNGDKWSWGYNYTPAGPSLWIGNEYANYNAGRWWKGGIPEVILYNRKLNTAQGNEADKVDTYLALKYGTTLLHSYYVSDGVKVFDTACNNKFNKDIVGLARDNASALNQKQSRSVHKNTGLTISVGNLQEFDNASNTSAIADKYTLIVGSNGKSGSGRDNTPIPGTFSAIPTPPGCLTLGNVTWSERKWQVQEQTGKDLGSVKVYIESKDIKAIDWSCGAYIVVGTNASFTNPVYYPLSPATGTAGSITDYVADINFCEGASNTSTTCGVLKTQYFAIVGKGNVCSPGGVSNGLVYWSRADVGTIEDTTLNAEADYGERVVKWKNLAGTKDAIVSSQYANTIYRYPYLTKPNRYDNFNPNMDFNNFLYSSNADYACMLATDVWSPKNGKPSSQSGGEGADSLTFFSAARPVGDFYNSTIGLGRFASYPGIHQGDPVQNRSSFRDYAAEINTATGSFTYYYDAANAPIYQYFPGYGLYKPNVPVNDNAWKTPAWVTTGMWYPKLGAEFGSFYNGGSAVAPFTDSIIMQVRDNGVLTGTTRTRDYNWYPAYNNGAAVLRQDVGIAGGYDDYGVSLLHDVIFYKKALNTDEMQRVETYLGLRNGVTIKHNYLATNSTVIWDTTYTDALKDTVVATDFRFDGYKHSVTGIGRDDAECLDQRVSRNVYDTVLTVALGTIPDDENNASVDQDFVNDREYMVWGSNGASMNVRQITDLPTSLGCIDSRLKREYRVRLTGTNTGNYTTQVRWQLPSNANLLDIVNATSITLMIDDDGDGDFTNCTRGVAATSYNAATNTIVFDNVTFSPSSAYNGVNDDACIAIGWSQVNIGKVKLYNGTMNGGGNYSLHQKAGHIIKM
jgi:hypothetical protein